MKQAERSKPHLRPENALDALRRVLGATTVAGEPGRGSALPRDLLLLGHHAADDVAFGVAAAQRKAEHGQRVVDAAVETARAYFNNFTNKCSYHMLYCSRTKEPVQALNPTPPEGRAAHR